MFLSLAKLLFIFHSQLVDASAQQDLYPNNGDDNVKNTHVSVYLRRLANPEKLSPGSQLLTEYTLRIVDQLNGKHKSKISNYTWFSALSTSWGWSGFIKLGNFKMSDYGFLVNNTSLVDAEATVHGIAESIRAS
ncbi:hypothetical protein ACE6H2_001018 [Prunus campanulata]